MLGLLLLQQFPRIICIGAKIKYDTQSVYLKHLCKTFVEVQIVSVSMNSLIVSY